MVKGKRLGPNSFKKLDIIILLGSLAMTVTIVGIQFYGGFLASLYTCGGLFGQYSWKAGTLGQFLCNDVEGGWVFGLWILVGVAACALVWIGGVKSYREGSYRPWVKMTAWAVGLLIISHLIAWFANYIPWVRFANFIPWVS